MRLLLCTECKVFLLPSKKDAIRACTWPFSKAAWDSLRVCVSSPHQIVSFPPLCCTIDFVYSAQHPVFASLIAKVLSEFRLALGELRALAVLLMPGSNVLCKKVGL